MNMPVTTQELDDFSRFTAKRLSCGETVPSLEECLRQWRANCEYQETVAEVQRSLEDCAAGPVKSFDQAFDEVRQRLGLWVSSEVTSSAKT